MKVFKKISIAFILIGLLTAGVLYEAYSITRKEYEKQAEVANDVRKEVNFDLNMIKIAVQTNDADVFNENLGKMKVQAERLKDLSFLENRLAGYKARLTYYIDLLDSKTDLLPQIKQLKTKVSEIATFVKENYVESKASRDKVREVNPKLNQLKIALGDYTNDTVKNVVNTVNGFLEEMAIGGTSLSDCIDTCYKDKISGINDGLETKIKAFADKTAELNAGLEKEFDLETLADLQ